VTTIRVAFRRGRSGRETALLNPEQGPSRRRPLRVAQMLALAHQMQATIDRREVFDRTALAHQLGFTRARVTQLLDLLLLAPDIQEEILFLELQSGRDPVHEHGLRLVAATPFWSEQRERWDFVKRTSTPPL
jgi:hypothetical protein